MLERAKTIFVTVIDETATPDIGTSPFIRDKQGAFYIYTSQLSSHVSSLIAGHKTRFMLITDESQSQNIWARVRVKFDAEIELIARDTSHFSSIADDMESVFGPTMGLIRQFSDFHMIKITPLTGVLVTGFAAAYEVSGPDFTIGAKLGKS